MLDKRSQENYFEIIYSVKRELNKIIRAVTCNSISRPRGSRTTHLCKGRSVNMANTNTNNGTS
jgi:hypothetical protein